MELLGCHLILCRSIRAFERIATREERIEVDVILFVGLQDVRRRRLHTRAQILTLL